MTRETAPEGGSQISSPETIEDDLTRARTLLDGQHLDAIETLWRQVDALWRHRRIDPELRADILRVATRIAPELVEQIEVELDIATPAVVLEAHFNELIEDRPTLGAFPTQNTLEAPSVEEWLKADPTRLRGVVLEMCRFTRNDRQVVTAVITLAERLGIALELAKDVVTHALIDARRPEELAK